MVDVDYFTKRRNGVVGSICCCPNSVCWFKAFHKITAYGKSFEYCPIRSTVVFSVRGWVKMGSIQAISVRHITYTDESLSNLIIVFILMNSKNPLNNKISIPMPFRGSQFKLILGSCVRSFVRSLIPYCFVYSFINLLIYSFTSSFFLSVYFYHSLQSHTINL